MEDNFDYYDDDDCESLKSCPKCNLHYDDIDYEYQMCRQCGWDAENNSYGSRRKPTNEDYIAGEADILTGRWE